MCVADLAFSKLSVPSRVDTHSQQNELKVKIAGLVAAHGEDVVREHLDAIPAASVPFAGDLIRALKERLPERTRGDRVAGHQSSYQPKYFTADDLTPKASRWEVDEDGFAVRTAFPPDLGVER